jgi:hypothetical protein
MFAGLVAADASLTVQSVGLAAVEARLAVTDPALFREYQVSHMTVFEGLVHCAAQVRLTVADQRVITIWLCFDHIDGSDVCMVRNMALVHHCDSCDVCCVL